MGHEYYLKEITPSSDVDILIHKPLSEKLNRPVQTLPQEIMEVHFIGTGTSNQMQTRMDYIQTIMSLYLEAILNAVDMQTSNNNYEYEMELPAEIELPDIAQDLEKLRHQELINEKL